MIKEKEKVGNFILEVNSLNWRLIGPDETITYSDDLIIDGFVEPPEDKKGDPRWILERDVSKVICNAPPLEGWFRQDCRWIEREEGGKQMPIDRVHSYKHLEEREKRLAAIFPDLGVRGAKEKVKAVPSDEENEDTNVAYYKIFDQVNEKLILTRFDSGTDGRWLSSHHWEPGRDYTIRSFRLNIPANFTKLEKHFIKIVYNLEIIEGIGGDQVDGLAGQIGGDHHYPSPSNYSTNPNDNLWDDIINQAGSYKGYWDDIINHDIPFKSFNPENE